MLLPAKTISTTFWKISLGSSVGYRSTSLGVALGHAIKNQAMEATGVAFSIIAAANLVTTTSSLMISQFQDTRYDLDVENMMAQISSYFEEREIYDESRFNLEKGFPIKLEEIDELCREAIAVLSDLSAFLDKSRIRSSISAPWRLRARRKSILARLKNLGQKSEKLRRKADR